MLKEKDAVIFDLDGTLVDSMWIWPAIDSEYMDKYGLVMPEGFQKALEGKSYTETAQYFLDTFPSLNRTCEEVQKEWIDMTFDKYTKEVPLKPGAKEFLEMLRNQGIKIGIATSNARELVDATLKALHIGEYFHAVRTACEVAAGKPAPDVYLKVSEDMGVDPCRCLVFEDVPNGIEAGKNAGMTVCGVDDAYTRPEESLKKKLADYYIRDYYDIVKNTYEVL